MKQSQCDVYYNGTELMKASFADPSRGFETDYGFDVRKPVE